MVTIMQFSILGRKMNEKKNQDKMIKVILMDNKLTIEDLLKPMEEIAVKNEEESVSIKELYRTAEEELDKVREKERKCRKRRRKRRRK